MAFPRRPAAPKPKPALKAKPKPAKPTKPATVTKSKPAASGGDDVAYWAAEARGALPEPFGETAAKIIESCGSERSKKHGKLVPGRPARRMLDAMGQSPEWAAAPPTDQAAVIGLLIDGAQVLERVVIAGLGRPGKLPAPLPVETDEPATFAAMPSVSAAPVIAQNILYTGKLGLMHGPAGGGKTTALANAVARITTGTDWIGQRTVKGTVLVCAEDKDTWKDALETARADQSLVKPVSWRDLQRTVAELQPVAVMVDTMQYIASLVGSGELDSAREVDRILRPLEALCRQHGTGIVVTDHEPWADGSGPTDAASGTKKRPRHSGAKVATCDYILRCSVDGATTTIERGAKVRRGIAIDTVTRIDIRGRVVKDLPAEIPPAVMGGAETGDDGQPFADPFAKWRDREPAIRGMLATEPAATDRAIPRAVGLPTGGRNVKAAYRFIAVVKAAILAGSIDCGSGASAEPEPYPPGSTGSTLPDRASAGASTPLPIDRKHRKHVLPDRASGASTPYRGSTDPEALPEAPDRASAATDSEALGSTDGDGAATKGDGIDHAARDTDRGAATPPKNQAAGRAAVPTENPRHPPLPWRTP